MNQVRKSQTVEELEADIKADEEAERKAAEEAAKSEQQPNPAETSAEPVVEKPAEQPVGDVAEVADLKAKLQAANDRVAELTKRVNDEDGRRGGELNALRHQVEQLGTQLREIVAENKALKDKAAPPPAQEEPDYLRKEFPEIADGVEARTSRVLSEAEKAKKAAEDANKTLEELKAERVRDAETRFFEQLSATVKDWETINTSPEFLAYLGERIKGTNRTRLDELRANRAALNVAPVIELFQDYAASKSGSAELPKQKKDKPSLESQQTPASAGAGASGKSDDKPKATKARLKELDDRIFVKGVASKDEREEYERLVDADAEGKLT